MKIPLETVIGLILDRFKKGTNPREEMALQLARINHSLERIADGLESDPVLDEDHPPAS